MKYVFAIKDNMARPVANINDDDSIITSGYMPPYVEHEGCHGELMWSEEEGIHWVYIPYTPAEYREKAYQTEKLIPWGEDMLTVDEANSLWEKYEAEGSAVAAELTVLIAAAKADIRERYPD